MAKPVIGLALGSGGARGWCHIGVIRALAELGIHPDVVAGCSMGALVGAAYAGGQLDALETWARDLTRRKFLTLIDVDLTSGGLVEGKAIAQLFAELGLPEKLEDLDIPFWAVASNLHTGREVWLKSGSLALAVRASASIPGVFSPMQIDGNWLVDGGITNPVPVSLVRALGADLVIAVNPDAHRVGINWKPEPESDRRISVRGVAQQISSRLPARLQGLSNLIAPSGQRNPSYVSVVMAAIEVMTEEIRRSRLAGDPPHVLLNARLNDLKVLELYRAAEAIEDGFRMVRQQKDVLLATVSGASA